MTAGSEDSYHEAEEDEEALSLIDLALDVPNLERLEGQSSLKQEPQRESEEDFGFPSRSNSFSNESRMCPADELFYDGQIKPLRGPVRLEAVSTTRNSVSESMDKDSSASRCGSARSLAGSYNPIRIRNLFCDCTGTKPGNPVTSTSGRKLPSPWSILRGGFVRGFPHGYRFVSRHSSSSSEKDLKTRNGSQTQRRDKQPTRDKNIRLFNTCKCSVVEVVSPWKIGVENEKRRRSDKRAVEQDRKNTAARERTYEWLKGL